MNNNKFISFIIAVFILISLFLLYQSIFNKPVNKVKMNNEEVSSIQYQKYVEDVKTVNDYFSPYRQIKNIDSNDYLFVFQKRVSDYSIGNYKYFIQLNDNKKDVSVIINNEHMLVLKVQLNEPLINNYKILIEDTQNQQIYEYNFMKAEQITLDISQITSEIAEKHEQIENQEIIYQSQIKEINRRIQTLEDEASNISRIDIKSDEDKKVISQSQSKIEEDIKSYQEQIEKINQKIEVQKQDNEQIETLFTHLFGQLHEH